MPYPITRNPTDDATLRDMRLEQLRGYVEQRLLSKFDQMDPSLLLDVVVSRRSDYDEVKVFVTNAALVEDMAAFLSQVEDELAAEGISILTYVRTWAGPASHTV